MIGFLRFFGVLNAAVWVGGAVYHTLVAQPALFSESTAELLQPSNYPFFSRALSQILSSRYFHFHVICSVIALLHLVAEWLYLGRPRRGFSFTLLALLFAGALIGSAWLQPKLRELHYASYSASATPVQRTIAVRSFKTWNSVAVTMNLLMLGGVLVHLWRRTHPQDAPRFITSVKFRG